MSRGKTAKASHAVGPLRGGLLGVANKKRRSPNHQHRAGGVADDALGGAAEEDMLQSGITMSGDDDQIGLQLFGEGSDFVERFADADFEADRNSLRDVRFCQNHER
jgi:hypothetical protein